MTLDTRPPPISLSGVTKDVPPQTTDYDALNDVPDKTKDDPALVTTSKGLRIRASAIPNMIMSEARRKIKPPKMPTVYIPDKETHEENPGDPEYVAALQEYSMQIGTMGVTAMLGFGTKVEHKPDDIEGPDDTAWSDDLKEIFDIDLPTHGKGRYAAWLRLYALTDPDLTAVLEAVRKASGIVLESEVAEAEDSFRDNAQRDPDEGALPTEEG